MIIIQLRKFNKKKTSEKHTIRSNTNVIIKLTTITPESETLEPRTLRPLRSGTCVLLISKWVASLIDTSEAIARFVQSTILLILRRPGKTFLISRPNKTKLRIGFCPFTPKAARHTRAHSHSNVRILKANVVSRKKDVRENFVSFVLGVEWLRGLDSESGFF